MRAARIALLGVLVTAGAWGLGAAPAVARPGPAATVARPGASEPAAAAARPGASVPASLTRGSSVAELNLSKALCGLGSGGVGCGGLGAGILGGPASSLAGGGVDAVASATANIGLAALGAWVVGGAAGVLHQTAAALGATTSPQLESTWFSATYWRMAAIAAMMTLPFLFAATVQAAVRSDVALLARAALGYLPLAILSIAIAAPLTTMLLAASDELCGLISAAASNESSHVLAAAGVVVAGLSAAARSPFLVFLVGLFAIGAAFALWIELLLREAAVYVVVLMLPLAFAALAWPARRMWAVRAVEILVALILSKFAIVAVLSLGGAAIGASVGHLGVSGLMAGTVLIMLAALSPWALLRFVPLTEIATSATGALRGEMRPAGKLADKATGHARSAEDWMTRATSGMRRDAERGMPDAGDPGPPSTSAAGDPGPGDPSGGPAPGSPSGDPGPGGPGPGGSDPGSFPSDAGPTGQPATTVGGPAAPAAAQSGATAAAESPVSRNADPSANPGTPADPGPPAGPAPQSPEPAPPEPAPPPPDPGPPPTERRWPERPILELGPNFGDTPVWPHEDAE